MPPASKNHPEKAPEHSGAVSSPRGEERALGLVGVGERQDLGLSVWRVHAGG